MAFLFKLSKVSNTNTQTRVEPSSEGAFLIGVLLAAGVIGTSAILTKIKKYRMTKNPNLFLDKHFGNLRYADQEPVKYPIVNDPSVKYKENKEQKSDVIATWGDSSEYSSHKLTSTNWIPGVDPQSVLNMYDKLSKFVLGVESLFDKKNVANETEKLADSIFGKGKLILKGMTVNGIPTPYILNSGFKLVSYPTKNVWTTDINWSIQKKINYSRQKVVDSVLKFKPLIRKALEISEDSGEDKLRSSLEFIKASLLVMSFAKHMLGAIDYEISNLKEVLDQVLIPE